MRGRGRKNQQPMGKAPQQLAVDHGSNAGDRITARVGSRPKKAKIVFDPSDHHVPRKRNRRGEPDPRTVTTPKSEPQRTTTPSSSSSTDGPQSASTKGTERPSAVQATTKYRHCRICGKNGPGRLPRKSHVSPWTCPGCVHANLKAGSANKQIPRPHTLGRPVGTKRVKTEEDTVQQHDFAGFSETELSNPGSDVTAREASNVNMRLLTSNVKVEPDEGDETGGDDVGDDDGSAYSLSPCKREADELPSANCKKEIRLWTCNDVCSYFGQHCPAWGDLFLEQEIDGASLLLLQRSDVLSRFGLKLGPAMELYQLIVALQSGDTETVDVRLTWI
ncbi:sterile alpha motif domain-containing protein 1 [Anopheles cruzii]|uniref:sterile alpha motif domain-containing protein 1 n=1 Tax=Anopheles cruzii TaxID=68878 RepID=UPI0022EC359E|nr:sterile alpha motif domain-containing protein 1 [Anopheles cruzii]